MPETNFYGEPITSPEYFDGEHVANPGPAGMPPVCSCGWTRHEVDGHWFEMADHIREMACDSGEHVWSLVGSSVGLCIWCGERKDA